MTVIGVDVGGTFTDLFLFDGATGRFQTAKVPSNRGDEASGFLNGLRALCPVAAIGSVVHGTTVGTNALLERKGARAGLITTAGFRDVLEMRRRDRRQTWGLHGDFVPVVDRDMRLEVPERTLAGGTIRTPVDGRAVQDAVLEACDRFVGLGAPLTRLLPPSYRRRHGEDLDRLAALLTQREGQLTATTD